MNGRENIIEALEFLKGYGIMRKEENLISTRIGRRFSRYPVVFQKKAGVYQIFVLEPEKSWALRDGVVHMEMPFAALKHP